MMKYAIPSPARLAAAIGLAVGATHSLKAATITVTTGGDATGTPATCTLRQAIKSANSDSALLTACAAGSGADVIVFADTVPSIITLTLGELSVVGGPLEIQGNGRTIAMYQYNYPCCAGYSYGRVLDVYASFTASDLTVTGGRPDSGAGGGIYVHGSPHFYLKNVHVTNNHASSGGGIYVHGSPDFHLNNCHITNNYAQGSGLGIALKDSTATIDNSFIDHNSLQYGQIVGAGVAAIGSTVTFNNSVISNNSAGYGFSASDQSQGGGVAAVGGSSVTFINSTVSSNSVDGTGGGVGAAGSSVKLVNTTIDSNYGWFAAGVSGDAGATLTILDSTVSNNTSRFGVGGLQVGDSTLNITNSTVSGNSGAQAPLLDGFFGGLFVSNSVAALVNTTVGNNHGTGIIEYASLGQTASVTLKNSITANKVADKNLGDCGSITPERTSITAVNSLIGDSGTACGIANGVNGNIVGIDPQLGALAPNGGPTKTMALGETSPAIGAGSVGLASFNSVPLNYDQRGFGFPRTFTGTIDMGAFQTQGDHIFVSGFEVGSGPPEP